MIAENNNITLVVLCKQIEAKTGIRVSVPTMCRILQKLKLGKNKKSAQAVEA
jgi:transposase